MGCPCANWPPAWGSRPCRCTTTCKTRTIWPTSYANSCMGRSSSITGRSPRRRGKSRLGPWRWRTFGSAWPIQRVCAGVGSARGEHDRRCGAGRGGTDLLGRRPRPRTRLGGLPRRGRLAGRSHRARAGPGLPVTRRGRDSPRRRCRPEFCSTCRFSSEKCISLPAEERFNRGMEVMLLGVEAYVNRQRGDQAIRVRPRLQ